MEPIPSSNAIFECCLRTRRFRAFLILGWLLFYFSGNAQVVPQRVHSEVLTIEGRVELLRVSGAGWIAAKQGDVIGIGDLLRTGERSRATVRLADYSVLRINELTIFSLEPPRNQNTKPILDLKSGSVFFYSREKPSEIHFRTPIAAGAIRGTEFTLAGSENGETHVDLIDGVVEIGNQSGWIELGSGEGATVLPGQGPVKVPLVDAASAIQWCLYYPAVVDPDELVFSVDERLKLKDSLEAYRSGDILTALSLFPDTLPVSSEALGLYKASLELAVGRVDQSRKLLSGVSVQQPIKNAIDLMIVVTKGEPFAAEKLSACTSRWMAESYYSQSTFKLMEALNNARAAVSNSPSFGFAWIRRAELELSLGKREEAIVSLARGLALSPQNAHGHAIRGFVLAARGQTSEAIAAFERAMQLNGSLGMAWLGRGLCRIRKGDPEGGRRDLQVAAALEPQRALFRSYLGKAFEHTGNESLADKEFRLARLLDPNDPTAWFYLALLNEQRNRLNEAISDLEKSKELNGNQAIFKSRFLLDKDQAFREASLARLYRDTDLIEVSVWEAASSLELDYANPSAHLFLSQSYEALIDPQQLNFRYSAPAYNEWFVGNLLSPGGSDALSRNITTRENAPFFVTDGPRMTSTSAYLSRGAWQETASGYGTSGNLDYSVDLRYQSDPGQRANNDFEALQLSAQTRIRVSDKDTVFLHVEELHDSGGDRAQYYDESNAQLGYRTSETLEPASYVGLHREWQPNSHTLFLAGFLHRTLKADAAPVNPLFVYYRTNRIHWINPLLPIFDESYRFENNTYTTELQHFWQLPDHTVIIGSGYQNRTEKVTSQLRSHPRLNIVQNVMPTEHRVSVYGYDRWQLLEPLSLTLGANLSWMRFPNNLDTAPVSKEEREKGLVSPKIGLIYQLTEKTAFRAHYTKTLGAASTDDNIQLEPTLVGGLNQTYHTIFPKSVVGVVPGSTLSTWALGIDHVFPTRTYINLRGSILESEATQFIGALTNSREIRIPDRPSTFERDLKYREENLEAAVNQLVGRDLALGVDYHVSFSRLQGSFPAIPNDAINARATFLDESPVLHQLRFHAAYNHVSGAFAQFQSRWSVQSNHGLNHQYPVTDFWEHDLFIGYRVPRRGIEVCAGVYNLTDTRYRLNPINYYNDLPQGRLFAATVTVTF